MVLSESYMIFATNLYSQAISSQPFANWVCFPLQVGQGKLRQILFPKCYVFLAWQDGQSGTLYYHRTINVEWRFGGFHAQTINAEEPFGNFINMMILTEWR
jgi:hypothetical protein